MKGISIIGPGRLGGAIALAIDLSGGRIESIVYRNLDKANKIREGIRNSEPLLIPFEEVGAVDASIILITSADPEISGIANAIAKFVRPGTIILHTSGSLSSDVLISVKSAGGVTGSMHPLVSVSDAFLGAERFAGVYFCIEGEAGATAAATSLAISLGGKAFSVPTDSKPLYHAAAVTASGHLVAVTDVAIEMLSACGLDAAAARETLLPLILSSIENLRTQAPVQALTGTFARADSEAFERHLAAMAGSVSSEALEIYVTIAERAIRLAETQGADSAKVAVIRNRISIAKRNLE